MTVFLDYLVISYGIMTFPLTNYNLWFALKLFAAVSVFLRIKQMKKTVYYPQAVGQVECFNKTIVMHLPHYSAENQTISNEYVEPRICAYRYNLQHNDSTVTAPVSWGLSRPLPVPTWSSPTCTLDSCLYDAFTRTAKPLQVSLLI